MKKIEDTLHLKIDLQVNGQLALIPPENPLVAPSTSSVFNDLTNQQQVLIFYYSMLAYGIKPRINVELAPIALFMHLILDKPYKSLQNSDFYKRLQTVPNFQNSKKLIRDLEHIKPFFLRVAWRDPVQLIDNDLLKAHRHL